MRPDLIPIVVGADGLYLDMSRLDGVDRDDLTDTERAWRTLMEPLAGARDAGSGRAAVPNLAEGWPKRAWPPWANQPLPASDDGPHEPADLVDDSDNLFGSTLFGSHNKVERAMRHAERPEESFGAVVSILRDLFSVFEGCSVELVRDVGVAEDQSRMHRIVVGMPPRLGDGFAAMLLDARVGGGVDLHRLKLPLTRPYAQWYGVYFEPELHVFVDPRDVRAHRWHLSRWQEGCHEGLEFKLDSVLHAYQPGTYFDAERVNHYGRGTGCFVFPTDDGWSQAEYDAATCRVEMVDTVGATADL